MRKLQHLPKYGPLVPRESFKMPRKENVFPRIHPELGIHWYYTHLSLTNTPIYHHLRMSTNSRFNWTTFSHSRLNIATLISVFPLWHRMMEWLCSRARIWGTGDLGIGACRSREMPAGAQGRVVGVRSNLGHQGRGVRTLDSAGELGVGRACGAIRWDGGSKARKPRYSKIHCRLFQQQLFSFPSFLLSFLLCSCFWPSKHMYARSCGVFLQVTIAVIFSLCDLLCIISMSLNSLIFFLPYYLICFSYYTALFYFLAVPCSMRDVSSTRDCSESPES